MYAYMPACMHVRMFMKIIASSPSSLNEEKWAKTWRTKEPNIAVYEHVHKDNTTCDLSLMDVLKQGSGFQHIPATSCIIHQFTLEAGGERVKDWINQIE